MKKSKKLLSLLLTICMLLSVVPIISLPASAAGSITMSCGITYDSSGNKITEGTNANVYCEEIPSWVLPVTFNSSGIISSTPVTGDFEVGSTYNFYLKFTDSYNCEFTSASRTILVRETDAVIIKFISNKSSSSAGTWKYSLNGAPSVSTGGVTFTAGTSADISLVASGTEITATAIPVVGYSVVLSSTDVTFKTNENGVATFDMPAKAVTVTATYTEIPIEFYAVLNKTEETGKVANTLSFYYDTNKDNYSDTTKYTVYSGDDLPTDATAKADWGYYEIRESIKNVVIDSSVAEYDKLTSTACMFYNFKYADDISGCEYLNVSNVTNMKNMFSGYAYYSANITAVPDVSDWNTSKVTTMYSMFFCYAYSSKSITAVPDVSNWNTEKVTNMNSMFSAYGYVSANTLESLDLSDWSINELTDASGMFFYYNYSATGDKPVVYGTDWSTKTGVAASSMFKDSKLKNATADIDSAPNWAKATTEEGGCFTVAPDRVFYAVLDSSNTLSFYYDRKKDTRTGTFYEGDDLPTDADEAADWGYNDKRNSVKNVVINKSVAKYDELTSTAYMFSGMTYADSISGCEYLDVSKVTNMNSMFFKFACNSYSIVTVPDVSNWKTDNVKNMNSMFRHYAFSSGSIAKVPDVSNWNTGNVTDMSMMFRSYVGSSIDSRINTVPNVSSWDTDNVTDMSYMFAGYCSSNKIISVVPDVTNWNTSNVTTMKRMFQSYASCSNATLETLDLSRWNTERITDSERMFYYYNHSNGTGVNPIVYATDWNVTNKNNVDASEMFAASTLKNSTAESSDSATNWAKANTSDIGCFTKIYDITNGTKEEDKATNNGYITIDKTRAVVNDTITVTVTPNEKYELDTLTYKEKEDVEATVITAKEGIYSFAMPKKDIIVSATFKLTNPVCEANGKQYETVSEALKGVGSTVSNLKLLKNTKENITIDNGQTITLDLNDKILQGDGTTSVITNKGTLNIVDNSATKTVKYFDKSNDSILWTLSENQATATNYFVTGAVITGGVAENGGGIDNIGGTLIIDGINLVGNKATGTGGAIMVGSGSLSITNCCIRNNEATQYGGGIDNHSDASITSSKILSNKANLGGGICGMGGKLTVCESEIKNNEATNGGGIFSWYNLILGNGTDIEDNISLGTIPTAGVLAEKNEIDSSAVTIKGKVIIKNNITTDNGTAQINANLCLFGTTEWDIVDISEIAAGSEIGVTTLINGVVTSGKFTKTGNATDKAYFTSDNDAYRINFNSGNYLETAAYPINKVGSTTTAITLEDTAMTTDKALSIAKTIVSPANNTTLVYATGATAETYKILAYGTGAWNAISQTYSLEELKAKSNVYVIGTVANGIDIAGAEIATINDVVYTGNAIEPKITVTYGQATLVKNVDYTVAYSNNTEFGEATVTITGIGNYTGTKSAKFNITDNTNPVIHGVVNGGVYYTTRIISASDTISGFDYLKVASPSHKMKCKGDFLLPFSDCETYTLEATDKAGNKTVVVFTIKPLTDITDSIANINADNVTSEDEEVINNVKKQLDDIDLTPATQAEKDAIQAAKDNCTALLKALSVKTFNDYKAEKKAELDKLDDYYDTIIDEGKKAIDEYIYVESKSVDENKEAVNKIVTDTTLKVEEQIKADEDSPFSWLLIFVKFIKKIIKLIKEIVVVTN